MDQVVRGFIRPAWTKEQDAMLIELWQDGYSGKEIAARINDGKSRNSVIGRAHRLGLSQASKKTIERGLAPRPPRMRLRRAAPLRRPLRVLEPIEPPLIKPKLGEVEPNGTPATFMELCSAACKWPVNADPPYMFCNRHRRGGSPYCDEHTLKSFQSHRTAVATIDKSGWPGI